MIYVNRNLKDGYDLSTYTSDFGITADILLKNRDKIFCHITNDGDILVETLCSNNAKIEYFITWNIKRNHCTNQQ